MLSRKKKNHEKFYHIVIKEIFMELRFSNAREKNTLQCEQEITLKINKGADSRKAFQEKTQ